MKYPEAIENLIQSFSRLPGVGEKTAARQALNIMKWDKEYIYEFSNSLKQITDLKFCRECGLFSDHDICEICSSEKRKTEKTMCVVESITDLMAIERSNQFSGVYHILGGVLNPLIGIGPDKLRIDILKERVIKNNVQTMIMAINPSVEGDATCSYIRQELNDQEVSIERIGFGMPMGGSLEYLDPLTISKALENRKSI
tara:strand:- start:151309 stop:151905 length:597 start_codon:yes stop_codon:yes gene_type:complete